MMSSEEDTDYYGFYGDKLLLKNIAAQQQKSSSSSALAANPCINTNTTALNNCNSNTINGSNNNNNNKRTRQRVDAGEPRNSYSSIPNFSSRPTFMNGGLYGAIFSQTQQFSLFGGGGGGGVNGNSGSGGIGGGGGVGSSLANNTSSNGSSNSNSGGNGGGGNNISSSAANNNSANSYGPVKMLNELLGRQVKQAQDATGPPQSDTANSLIPSANTLDSLLSNNTECANNLAQLVKQNQQTFGELGDSCSPNLTTVNGNQCNPSSDASSGLRRNSNNNNNCDPSDSNNHNNNNGNSDENNSDLLISSTSPSSQSQSPHLNCANANDLAHHMLRNILQQSKKDLLAFDQEIQRVAQQQQQQLNANNNNNSGNNNPSNNSDLCTMISDTKISKGGVKLEQQHGGATNENSKNSGNMLVSDLLLNDHSSEMNNCKSVNNNNHSVSKKKNSESDNNINENNNMDISDQQNGGGGGGGLHKVSGLHNGHHLKSNKPHDSNNNENANNNHMTIDSDNDDNSNHSDMLLRSSKDDEIDMIMERSNEHRSSNNLEKMDRNSSISPVISSSSSSTGNNQNSLKNSGEPVALDMKRARVENIVSTMRSSPALPLQQQNQQQSGGSQPVNGCKKRKLYHPQQHDNTAAERYAAAAAAGLNLGLNLQNLLLANNHLQQSFLANAQLNDLDDDLDDDNTARNGDLDLTELDECQGNLDSPQLHQKRVEKNALKSQLRSMQEQLAEMQQKYVQLCTRMEQEIDDNSESEMLNDTNLDTNVEEIEDLDDDNDDVEEDPNNGDDDVVMDHPESPTITTTTTPLLTTTTTMSSNRSMMRNLPSPPDSNNNNINKQNQANASLNPSPRKTMQNLAQAMNKMMPMQQSNKMQHPGLHPSAVQAAAVAALHSHLPMPGSFGGPNNAQNPLLQHLQHGVQNNSSSSSAVAAAAAAHELLQQQNSSSQQQHALSSALNNAMYLGVSQKLFLEQEARHLIAKEEEQQREMIMMRDRDREREREQQRERMQQQQQQQQQSAGSSGPSIQQQMNPNQNHSAAAQNHHMKGGHKIQDRLNMMRSNTSHMMMGPIMSGSELEGFADMLKSEITASLSHLVDTIVTRFLHQKRFLGKQSEAAAAAAEQLSKDLMMASQLLDRKSPRTKIADRPIGPNQSAAMFQAPKVPSSAAQQQQQQQQANHQNKVAALNQVAAAALYNSMNQFCLPPPPMSGQSQSSAQNSQMNVNGGSSSHPMDQQHHMSASSNPEQTEALPLVVAPKKKRHKVTDTRITPRTVSRILAQDGIMPPQTGQNLSSQSSPLSLSSQLFKHENEINNNNSMNNNNNNRENHGDNGNNRTMMGSQITPPVSSSATNMTSPHASSMSGNNGNHNNNINSSMNSSSGNQKGMNYNSSSSLNSSNLNGGSANSPMTSPQSRQPQIPGGNPTTPSLHYSQQYHPSLPSLPPNQQSMMPVSLPTSVAIPNPSLPEESEVFSPYSPLFSRHGHGDGMGGAGGPASMLNGGGGLPYGLQPSQFNHHHHHHHIKMSSSPPGLGGMIKTRDSPPLPLHHSTMLHPALLAAAHHGNSPDYSSHMRHSSMDSNNNTNDRGSDCNDPYDGAQPTISFSNSMYRNAKYDSESIISLTSVNSSTLTPMHLRKAKLMFFWVRYPSSAVLKMYFPDIRFNKNNTAQLVKWFSNFREFYYIQMEKYARQSVTEGVKSVDDIQVNGESEIYRVLNLHYNRNNHIEVPVNFRYVVEQTLREFYKSIQGGKDTEQSWKKSIYKIISRLDDPVPEYFKSPNFLEQLE